MTPQSNFMIMAVIQPDRKEDLRQLLASLTSKPGYADAHNELIPFARLDTLHMARFTIIEAHTADDIRLHGVEPTEWQPKLVFLGDCDGEAEILLRQMVAMAESGLRQVFSHCEDYSEHGSLLDWLLKRNIKASANYINWVGRTVKQIREEAALHKTLLDYLQDNHQQLQTLNLRELRQRLLTHVELELDAGRLTLSKPEPTPSTWKIKNLAHKFGIPLILLLLSPLLVVSAPIIAIWLRSLENSDPEIALRPDREHIKTMTLQEDHDVSNHFNVFGDVKPGILRLILIKFLLLVLDYSSRHIYKRGFLTRIRTIHFARWVLLENNRHIYFASNYDGSHESYMDDFINKVAWGLNLVFSNGVGYPATRWLVKGGAEREHLYKYTLRRHQLPSELWYKAYPGLTAYDLSRNSRIRAGVENYPVSDEDIRQWLRLI